MYRFKSHCSRCATHVAYFTPLPVTEGIEKIEESGRIVNRLVRKPFKPIDPRLKASSFDVANSIENDFNLQPVSFNIASTPENQVKHVENCLAGIKDLPTPNED